MSLVLKSFEDGILTLTVHRPEALNALNRNVIDALSAALEAAQDNDDVRVIVLTGAGEKAFVAGADIKEFADFDQAQGEDSNWPWPRMCASPRPTPGWDFPRSAWV